MEDGPLLVWLEIIRSKVGNSDTTVALSIINDLIDKLKKKNGIDPLE